MLQQIVADRLAGAGRLAPDAQQIVDGLKGRADMATELGQRPDVAVGAPARMAPIETAQARRAAGLALAHLAGIPSR